MPAKHLVVLRASLWEGTAGPFSQTKTLRDNKGRRVLFTSNHLEGMEGTEVGVRAHASKSSARPSRPHTKLADLHSCSQMPRLRLTRLASLPPWDAWSGQWPPSTPFLQP